MNEKPGGSPEERENGELTEEQTKKLREKVVQKLLIDKVAVLDELIDMSAVHINLEASGKVHIKNPENKTGAELIALVLVGKKLANLAGLCSSDLVGIDEVVETTGQVLNVATARLSELKRDGIVQNPSRGAYRIASLAGVRKVLMSIGAKARSQGGQ
jgi:hypothetical protein